MEGVLLILVCLAPWALGAAEPVFEFLLYIGLCILLALWSLRVLSEGQARWYKCPVALCLAALFLLGLVQMQPLPRPLLAILSPNAARIYAEMLPANPEHLESGEPEPSPPLAAGASISLYPGATYRELFRLLAVFLLFAVVRNNLTTTANLRRLFLVLVANGTLLAFFALLQMVSSPPGLLYWSIPVSAGAVFGPFICKNHFPFYVNICVAAGIGLFLSLSHGKKHQSRRQRGIKTSPFERSFDQLLTDPRRMWLVFALAFMGVAILLSLSRGGVLALVGAGAVLVLFLARAQSHSRKHGHAPAPAYAGWLGPVAVGALAAFGLLAWFGIGKMEARLGAAWEVDKIHESRLPLWLDTVPLLGEYPVFGTGLGTFVYIEPLHRERNPSSLVFEHAHNEYLEALVEGGIVRLAISVAAIWLVYHYGLRAYRRNAKRSAGGLVLGGLLGFTTIVIHSFGEFGLHLPSIAVLATVLVAELVAIGQGGHSHTSSRSEPSLDTEAPANSADVSEAAPETTESPAGTDPGRHDSRVFTAGGLAPVGMAILLIALGALLWAEGRRMERVESLLMPALRPLEDGEILPPLLRIRPLYAAATRAPESARVQVLLGQAFLGHFEQRQAELDRGSECLAVAQSVLCGIRMPLGSPLAPALGMAATSAISWESATAPEREKLARQYMDPALRAFLRARDLCPLLARPNVYLASHRQFLAQAEPRSVYLDRAKRVVTNDPEMWFLFGAQELLDGQRERAIESWHHSLDVSDQYVKPIVELSKTGINPQVLLEEVLPNRANILAYAAGELYPEPTALDRRKPFYEQAVKCLRARPATMTAGDRFLLAQLYRALGQNRDSLECYRLAVALDPRKWEWRLEYATALRENGRLTDSRAELLSLLRHQPQDNQLREMIRALDREITLAPNSLN